VDWTALIAGAIGGIAGALGTGGVTSWRDRRNERRRLSAAIGMVAVELKENRERIERVGRRDVKKHLTLQDWADNKAILAEHLEPRNEPLWNALVTAYNMIYEAKSEIGEAPSAETLGDLKRRLDNDRSQLNR
jgi:hypothetical protein